MSNAEEKASTLPLKESSRGVLPMQLLFSLYHQETKRFLQQATESKVRLLLCAVEAPASLYPRAIELC